MLKKKNFENLSLNVESGLPGIFCWTNKIVSFTEGGISSFYLLPELPLSTTN